jgi:hypothetical protein
MAWHGLIANLGTLTINEVRLPIVEPQTFHMLMRPTRGADLCVVGRASGQRKGCQHDAV